MKIIVGLGNPGIRYRKTRHNFGFMVIDALAKKYRLAVKKKGFQGLYGAGRILQQEVFLFKPHTYMNLSGEAVKAVCSSHLERKEDLLVIADDLDLPLGRIRLREKGSSGGHNGLRSIIDKIGQDFTRLKIGIAKEGEIEEASSYVLSSFNRKEKVVLAETVPSAVECTETWLELGVKEAMNRYNSSE